MYYVVSVMQFACLNVQRRVPYCVTVRFTTAYGDLTVLMACCVSTVSRLEMVIVVWQISKFTELELCNHSLCSGFCSL